MSIDYARMPVPARWHWHAEVYACRRVMLSIPPNVRTSPCDPHGTWFDRNMVEQAELALRARLAEQASRCKASTAAHNALRFAAAEAQRHPPPEAAE